MAWVPLPNVPSLHAGLCWHVPQPSVLADACATLGSKVATLSVDFFVVDSHEAVTGKTLDWQVRRGLPLQDLSGKRGFPDEGPPKGSGGPLDPAVQVAAAQAAQPGSKPAPEAEVPGVCRVQD